MLAVTNFNMWILGRRAWGTQFHYSTQTQTEDMSQSRAEAAEPWKHRKCGLALRQGRPRNSEGSWAAWEAHCGLPELRRLRGWKLQGKCWGGWKFQGRGQERSLGRQGSRGRNLPASSLQALVKGQGCTCMGQDFSRPSPGWPWWIWRLKGDSGESPGLAMPAQPVCWDEVPLKFYCNPRKFTPEVWLNDKSKILPH